MKLSDLFRSRIKLVSMCACKFRKLQKKLHFQIECIIKRGEACDVNEIECKYYYFGALCNKLCVDVIFLVVWIII